MLIIGKLVLPMALFSKIYDLAIFVVNEYVGIIVDRSTLGDIRNISTIFIFLLAVPPYNFCNFYTKIV